MKNVFYLAFLALLLVGCSKKSNDGGSNTNTSQPYVVDNSFASPISSFSLNTGAVQADGKIVAGGNGGLVRFNTDGSVDALFKPPAPLNAGANIYSVAIQTDGKIIVSGQFTAGNKVSIARLNADGTLDNGFRLSTDIITALPIIRTVLVQPDGKIIIVGTFDYPLGSFLASGIARLETDGKLDPSFKSPRYSAAFTTGKALLLPSGKIMVVTNSGGAMLRLNSNGTIDPAFIFNSKLWATNVAGIPGNITTLTSTSNSKLLVGGNFVGKDGDANGLSPIGCNGVLLLNEDGSEVVSFKSPEKGIGAVNTILPLANGDLMVGRNGVSTDDSAIKDNLNLLDPDGAANKFEVTEFTWGGVQQLLLGGNNNLYVLGSFLTGQASYKGILRLKASP